MSNKQLEIFKLLLKQLELHNFDHFTASKDHKVDEIGCIYEQAIPFKDRKDLGEIYTPKIIVNHILESVKYVPDNYIENLKLIDISCGSGSFLIEAVNILKERLLIHNGYNAGSLIPIEIAKKVLNTIRDNISGVDINPVACILCQLNMYRSLFDIIKTIQEGDPKFKFELFGVFNKNAFKIIEVGKYDYVVGNPPYIFIRDISSTQRELIESSNFQTNKGQYDYYQIFIELGLRMLKNHGYLGYIVPDSLLALSNRKELRKLIYNNTKIEEITIVGSQFDDPIVSNIIIILKREEKRQERTRNEIKILDLDKHFIQVNKITQSMFEKFDFQFLVNLNPKDIKVLDTLNKNYPKLGELLNDCRFKILLSRGVELGKDGKVVYCPHCKKYFPFPKRRLECPLCNFELNEGYIDIIIHDSISNVENNKVKRFLKAMNRYQVKDYKFIEINKPGINYKDEELYHDRIVIRQLSQNNLICATYDDFSYTSQSFYNLRIKDSTIPEFSNYYLLGLINSTLLSFYFIKSFGSYKMLFPRILLEKIKVLPIKLPLIEIEKILADEINDLVRKLLFDTNKEERKLIFQKKIDSIIFRLYNIDDDLVEHIKTSLNPI